MEPDVILSTSLLVSHLQTDIHMSGESMVPERSRSRATTSDAAAGREQVKPVRCHTCRRQRLRCDGSKPGCSKCAARGVECLGYGAHPLLWVQPQSAAPSPRLRQDAGAVLDDNTVALRSGQGPTKKKGRPKLVFMSQSDDKSDPADFHGRQLQIRPSQQSVRVRVQMQTTAKGDRRRGPDRVVTPRMYTNLDPVDYQNHRLALHSLDYYNDIICPDLVLLDTATNPHRFPLRHWNDVPELFHHMVVATSLTHQVIRSRHQELMPNGSSENSALSIRSHRMSSLRSPWMPAIYRHHQRTLKALNEELHKEDARYGHMVLGAVILLMRVEIQQSAFGAWPTHLEAARTIIAHRGGISQLANERFPYVEEDLTDFLIIDVVNSVMTPTLLMDSRTLAQLEYVPLLGVFYKDGKNCDFPCPSQLLEAMIRTNHARALSRDAPAGDEALDEITARILAKITSFNAADWARKHVCGLSLPTASPSPPSLSSSSSSVETIGDSPNRQGHAEGGESAIETAHNDACAAIQDMCEDLGTTFHQAVMLYCIRTLYLDRRATNGSRSGIVDTCAASLSPCLSPDLGIDVTSVHSSALDALLAALHRLWAREDATRWCGKMSFWPLFMAGMEIDPGPATADERAFICGALRRLVFHLGELSPLDAVWQLQLIWHRTAGKGGGQQTSWDDRLTLPGVRGLFIF